MTMDNTTLAAVGAVFVLLNGGGWILHFLRTAERFGTMETKIKENEQKISSLERKTEENSAHCSDALPRSSFERFAGTQEEQWRQLHRTLGQIEGSLPKNQKK